MALRPLIAICGTTGVGKSKLAIELALHLSKQGLLHGWQGAKVINADAMQVYDGMDVITNKVTRDEMQGVPHVLMGFKSPNEQYVVGQWVRDAMAEVENAHQNKQIPIVVGGTSYWIQHLLFPNRLVQDLPTEVRNTQTCEKMSDELVQSISTLPADLLALFNALPDVPPSADTDPEAASALYRLLRALDSSVAQRWHWKDTRKVMRSLRIIQESGRKPSEIIDEQSQEALTPRYRTLCFWVYAVPDILKPRLDSRVDRMIEQGLLDEVRELQRAAEGVTIASSTTDQNSASASDYTFGIYQSIGKVFCSVTPYVLITLSYCAGYREFHKYLLLPAPSKQDFATALENMKISTRQYAKRQISWLRNKLLPALYAGNKCEQLSWTYVLDATALDDLWLKNVRQPAVNLCDSFLNREPLPDPSSLSDVAKQVLSTVEHNKPTDPTAVLNSRKKVVCPSCTTDPLQPYMVDGREWEAHQKSRGHRRQTTRPKRTQNESTYQLGTLDA
ncbi:tRNA isopentenyltransferase [Dendrothele bispora CBS 962.96]|uniref:tRNA isopentenyltransferase n=1 Tax=Dendrothele bispora (strain CBS 962.96) TaxID=1314807 RepID=A0A4S8MXG6_DENBC|nr:tRNA isopentenyltransferase [Dendrothele bispora CBS 962.96]